MPGGAEACVELSQELSAAGQVVTTQVYEGVGHAWDISDIAPGHTHVLVPEASADSRQRLLAFLALSAGALVPRRSPGALDDGGAQPALAEVVGDRTTDGSGPDDDDVALRHGASKLFAHEF